MQAKQNRNMDSLFQGTSSYLDATDPEWVNIVTAFSQKEGPSASKLTERERLLCVLSSLLGCQGMSEYQHMLHAALNSGMEPVAIKEMLYQATAYLGIGRVHDFLKTTNQIMEQHGISSKVNTRANCPPTILEAEKARGCLLWCLWSSFTLI